jgi:hypothetical protein
MEIITYSTPEERQRILSEQTSAGLSLRKDVRRPNGIEELHFLEPDEIAAEDTESARAELAASDMGLARGLEDLIDILEADNMNIRARLPQELRDKLARRAELRGLISG